MAYPTNPGKGKKKGEWWVWTSSDEEELMNLVELVWQVEHGMEKVETRLGPYRVSAYRVDLAGGPVIRLDLSREEEYDK